MGDDPWGLESYGEKNMSQSQADASDTLFFKDSATVEVEMNGPYGGLHEMNPLLLGENINFVYDFVRRN